MITILNAGGQGASLQRDSVERCAQTLLREGGHHPEAGITSRNVWI